MMTTMGVSVYLTVALSFAFLLGCLFALAFVDESTTRDTSQPYEDTEASVNDIEDSPPGSLVHTDLMTLVRSRSGFMALSIFLAPALAVNISRILLTYLLRRFHRHPHSWSIQQISACLSEVDLLKVFLYLLVMPHLILWIQRRFRIHQTVIDVGIIRMSVLFLTVGTVLIAVATDFALMGFGECTPSGMARRVVNLTDNTSALAIFTAGFGLRVSLLSYTTSLAKAQMRGRLYGIVQIVESLGHLITWPILQGVWAESQDWVGFDRLFWRIFIVLVGNSSTMIW